MYKTSTQKISLRDLFAIFKRVNIWEMELSYWTKPPKDKYVDVYSYGRNLRDQKLDQYADVYLAPDVFKNFKKIKEDKFGREYIYTLKSFDKIYKKDITTKFTINLNY